MYIFNKKKNSNSSLIKKIQLCYIEYLDTANVLIWCTSSIMVIDSENGISMLSSNSGHYAFAKSLMLSFITPTIGKILRQTRLFSRAKAPNLEDGQSWIQNSYVMGQCGKDYTPMNGRYFFLFSLNRDPNPQSHTAINCEPHNPFNFSVVCATPRLRVEVSPLFPD